MLSALGVSDYGIFVVATGLVTAIGFLNGAILVGTQRHLAHALGRAPEAFGAAFKVSFYIHLVIAGSVLIIGSALGWWLITGILKIDESRRLVGYFVFEANLLASVASILSLPYSAILLAKERFGFYSLCRSLQSVALLIAAIGLSGMPGDDLLIYSLLHTLVLIVFSLAPIAYARRHLDDCGFRFRPLPKKDEVVDQLSFSAWNTLGAIGVAARLYGTGVVLNLFYGTQMSAAYGLASIVFGNIMQVTQVLTKVAAPMITKLEGAGRRSEMIEASERWCRLSALVGWVISFVILGDVNFVLATWLNDVPAHTATLTFGLALILAIDSLTSIFMVSIQATGRVTLYQITLGVILTSTVPAAYFLSAAGYGPKQLMAVIVCISALSSILRVVFFAREDRAILKRWCVGVFIPIFATALVSLFLASVIKSTEPPTGFRFLIIQASNLIITGAAGYWLVLTASQRRQISRVIAIPTSQRS